MGFLSRITHPLNKYWASNFGKRFGLGFKLFRFLLCLVDLGWVCKYMGLFIRRIWQCNMYWVKCFGMMLGQGFELYGFLVWAGSEYIFVFCWVPDLGWVRKYKRFF